MIMPIQFDKLQYIKTLESGGVPPGQAEAHADALRGLLDRCPVLLESDQVLLRAEFHAALDAMRGELSSRINLLYGMFAIQFILDGVMIYKLFS